MGEGNFGSSGKPRGLFAKLLMKYGLGPQTKHQKRSLVCDVYYFYTVYLI